MPYPFAIATFLAVLLSLKAMAQDSTALTPSGDPAPIRAVKLVTPESPSGLAERTFFGRITALETLDLSFEVGGRLIQLDAVEGQTLPKGARIASLELGPFERSVERAEVALAQAERDLQRLMQLSSSNTVSDVQVEDARTARDLADVTLREVRDALVDAALYAPFDALVAARLAANFSNVTPGQAIVRLHDMSEIQVEIDVPERLFQSTSNPDAITFTAELPTVAEPVPLTLREFNAETGAVGQSFRVTLALPPLNIPTLIPGASLTVKASSRAQVGDRMVLPASAILPDADKVPRVLVFEPEEGDTGIVRWEVVEVTSLTGSDIAVMGLAPDSLVVAAGAQLLKEGERVRRYTGLTVEE